MKFSELWLRQYVNPEISSDELSHRLSMAGLEVDSMNPAAVNFSGIVVAEVLKVEDHPDADKLHICQVNVGTLEPLTIVCGAPNVKPGMKVPGALIGAQLQDFKIKKAKLRGVESFGMLCSAKELGLAETSDGLLPLPSDAPVGVDVREYLELNDTVIDVDLTPNRGDCASMIGIAREVGAITNANVNVDKVDKIQPVIKDTFPVKLKDEQGCPHYVGRIIKGIDPQAKTPLWMQERLRRGGIRSIAPIVDVTNYVLLELGQPMHAFDLAKLSKHIEVRFAKTSERLSLLNNDIVDLSPDTLVIADAKGPIAMAGIMGGLDTAVTESTHDIFLESAFFNPVDIAGRARRYGCQSDSSYRFERGVDYDLQIKAIERATQLLLEIVGGKPGPVTEETSKKYMPQTVHVTFRPTRANDLLGIEIHNDEMLRIFNTLGVDIRQNTTAEWTATIPSYRFDLRLEEDLIEEIGRIYGYEQIPAKKYVSELSPLPINQHKVSLKRLRDKLQDLDYHEIVAYSFISESDFKLFDPAVEPVQLTNPISSDMSVMRSTLWPGLMNTLIFNLNRQHDRVRLFETGLRFKKLHEGLQQKAALAGLIYGPIYSEQWGEKNRQVDFYDMKSDIEALLQLKHVAQPIEFKRSSHPALHPGRSADIYIGDKMIGSCGELHPDIANKKDLRHSVYLFEFELDLLQQTEVPRYQPTSKFPSVRRDLALIVDEKISVNEIKQVIQENTDNLLKDLFIFDVYQGKNIEFDKKSVALGMILQDPLRTLNDDEINDIIEHVLLKLESNLGAKLRT